MGAFDVYNPLTIQKVLFTIIVVFVILTAIYIYYFFSIRKLDPKKAPKGFALIIFSMVQFFQTTVAELLGPKFAKMTPYFIYLFSYIFLSNIIGIFGLDNPTMSATVTISMGLVTFIGSIVVGLRYQRLSYFRQFAFSVKIKNHRIPIMINPLEIIGKITPLISISMRLWGNIFAGALITILWFVIPIGLSVGNGLISPTTDPFLMVGDGSGHPSMIVMSLFTPPLNMYLDLLTGAVQAFVFVLLTMVYWKMEMGHGEPHSPIKINENSTSTLLNRVEHIQ